MSLITSEVRMKLQHLFLMIATVAFFSQDASALFCGKKCQAKKAKAAEHLANGGNCTELSGGAKRKCKRLARKKARNSATVAYPSGSGYAQPVGGVYAQPVGGGYAQPVGGGYAQPVGIGGVRSPASVGRCKNFPPGSCNRKKCRCQTGVRRASQGLPILNHTNKRGQPTINKICAQNAHLGVGGAWQALKQVRPKIAHMCLL